MGYNLRTPPPTRVTGQPEIVVDGSPLAVIGIFIAFLRERFSPNNGPPNYPWYTDENKTSILIESGFETNVIPRGDKPAIYIDKDQCTYGKVVIGDRAGHRFRDGAEAQWCLATVPLLIDCVSSRRGESAVIGDITQWSIHASSDAIQAAFSLHEMTPPTLGRTIPFEDDQEAWTTPVSFQLQYHVRWLTIPIRPLLSEISLRIRDSNLPATEYFTVLATKNTFTLPDS